MADKASVPPPPISKIKTPAATYKTAGGYKVNTQKRLEPIARILLMGTYDDNNIFSALRGTRYILKAIWEYTIDFNKHYWPQFIKFQKKNMYVIHKKWVNFPKPTNININMMPFKLTGCFDTTYLPKYLEPYFIRLIKPCLICDFTQLNRICFLTINESLVKVGHTQRRPGIHTESPGYIQITSNNTNTSHSYVKGGGKYVREWIAGTFGGGYPVDKKCDGVYMASTLDNTTVAWDCQIVKVHDRDVIGHLGDIQHLKSSLPSDTKKMMKGKCLYWITDRTPHEGLPMKKTAYRQFFRLVTHDVNIWHQKHATPNPNGLLPDTSITKIVTVSKFK